MPCLLPTISFYFPIFIDKKLSKIWGFPGGTGSKEPAGQCSIHKRQGFYPQDWEMPWRREWQPTPVFLPGLFPWTEESGGYNT